jgi:hypothetical protein
MRIAVSHVVRVAPVNFKLTNGSDFLGFQEGMTP